uniref:Zinc finger, matrin-type 5 n=1 Tax=Oncorhynchus kisutch TaxID=8019 RepID=A0A8C7CGT0_ONCKI
MHNRKNHLYGVQHHRSKKAWFDHFRDTAAILDDERTKKPCQCVFGNNCRFSHIYFFLFFLFHLYLTRMQIETSPERSIEDPEDRASPELSIEEFLTRGEKRRATLSSGSVLKEEDDDDQPENDIPPHFLTIPDLPPSLLPPPPSGSKVWLN